MELWLILYFARNSYFACPYRGARNFLRSFFHCSRKIYDVWVQQNKTCPNRAIFYRLTAFQSCPNSTFFVKITIIIKICRFWATLESCQLVKYCPIWTGFILLNSHRVDLQREMKKWSQKFSSAPVRTHKIWFARKISHNSVKLYSINLKVI